MRKCSNSDFLVLLISSFISEKFTRRELRNGAEVQSYLDYFICKGFEPRDFRISHKIGFSDHLPISIAGYSREGLKNNYKVSYQYNMLKKNYMESFTWLVKVLKLTKGQVQDFEMELANRRNNQKQIMIKPRSFFKKIDKVKELLNFPGDVNFS